MKNGMSLSRSQYVNRNEYFFADSELKVLIFSELETHTFSYLWRMEKEREREREREKISLKSYKSLGQR